LRVLNVYVVNGKSVGSDKYQHKLKWLKKLNSYCKSSLTEFKNFVVLGDFNIAPTDNDVFDIESTKDQILCSVDERKSFNNLLKLGLYDLFEKFDFSPQTFTWWDYRAGAFHRNIGYRIDHILGSKSVLDGCKSFIIDKETRHKSWCKKEPRTSDHAPVRVELSL
ncbi:MAG: exodeoxyribonuclease III, partial [Gammaproteobacteria bacterium]|nr:exodeoxyribonuclease III [Gammaproteobacteria bacterium]